MTTLEQLLVAFVLAIPVACVAWTATHEEVFKEVRDWCVRKSQNSRLLIQRKFFYLFTCEYCFSHYVTIGVLVLTRFKLLYGDFRGFLIAGFTIVWLANLLMSLFGRLRLDIKHERAEIEVTEAEAAARKRRPTIQSATPLRRSEDRKGYPQAQR